jgi:hypothetical protein
MIDFLKDYLLLLAIISSVFFLLGFYTAKKLSKNSVIQKSIIANGDVVGRRKNNKRGIPSPDIAWCGDISKECEPATAVNAIFNEHKQPVDFDYTGDNFYLNRFNKVD